jgi:tetratricopeptide (TPR) repeat protein
MDTQHNQAEIEDHQGALRMSFLYKRTIMACTLSGVFFGSLPAMSQQLEVTSGLGRKLYALPDNPAIEAARGELAKDPKNVALILKLSKAEAGQRQYKEAILTDTQGIASAPGNADLYIERGHRELGLRQFRQAMTDLEHAVSLDPTKLDAHYHLGLSHYFEGEFSEAAKSFKAALDLAKTSDSVIDCSNWLYVSLRRAGKKEEATAALKRITPEMTNTEPHLKAYLQLLRFYQSAAPEASVLPPHGAPGDIESELGFNTQTYGAGNWHLYNGDPKKGVELFKSVVPGEAWNSWGFIGSETELVRMTKTP